MEDFPPIHRSINIDTGPTVSAVENKCSMCPALVKSPETFLLTLGCRAMTVRKFAPGAMFIKHKARSWMSSCICFYECNERKVPAIRGGLALHKN